MRPAFVLAVALFCVGCDASESDPRPVYGEVTASVTSSDGSGTTFTGGAYATYNDDAFERFLLYETDDSGFPGPHSILVFATEEGPLHPGTYSVGSLTADSTATPFTVVFSDQTTARRSIVDITGELVIDEVTETTVRGRVMFGGPGRPLTEEGPTLHTVEADFDAFVIQSQRTGVNATGLSEAGIRRSEAVGGFLPTTR